MFKFITHRNLFINILVGIFIVLLLVVLFFLGLGYITNHGKTETVPNIIGKNIEAAKLLLEAKGFVVEVSDSTYTANQPRLSVLKQTPDADAIVKHGRIIFLTVNKQVPPSVTVPSILGFSLKSALYYLADAKLVLGDTTFVHGFAKNTVEEIRMNGYKVEPGTKVFEGTKIDLVISSGPGDEIDVPNVMGLSYREALSLIKTNQLNIGIVIANPNVKDTMNAFVYRQSPESYFEPLPNQKINTQIRIGQMMDLWLSFEKPILDSTAILDSMIKAEEAIELEKENNKNKKNEHNKQPRAKGEAKQSD